MTRQTQQQPPAPGMGGLGAFLLAVVLAIPACASGGLPIQFGTTPAADAADSTAGQDGKPVPDPQTSAPEAGAGLTTVPNLLVGVSSIPDLQLRDEVSIDEDLATYVAPDGRYVQTRAAYVDAIPMSMLASDDVMEDGAPTDAMETSYDPTTLVPAAPGFHYLVFTIEASSEQPDGEAEWKDNLLLQADELADETVEVALVTTQSQSFELPYSGDQTWVLSVEDGVTPKITFTVDDNTQTLLIEQGVMDTDAAASAYRLNSGLAQLLNAIGPETIAHLVDRDNYEVSYQPTLEIVQTSTWDAVEGFAPDGMKWVQIEVLEVGNEPMYGNSAAFVPHWDGWTLTVNGEAAERVYTEDWNHFIGMSDHTIYTTFLVPIDATAATLTIATQLELDPGNPPTEMMDATPFVVELTFP